MVVIYHGQIHGVMLKILKLIIYQNPLGLLTSADVQFIASQLNQTEFSAINMDKIYSAIILFNLLSLELIMNSESNATYNFECMV